MEHLPHSRAESHPVILLGEGLEHQRDTTEFQVLKLETFLGRAGVAVVHSDMKKEGVLINNEKSKQNR